MTKGIKNHSKYKLWLKNLNPDYIVTFSTDGSIWVSPEHVLRIKARCPEVAIQRAKILLEGHDDSAVFVSCKKYYKKNKKYGKRARGKRINESWFIRAIQNGYLLNFKRLKMDGLIGIQPMSDNNAGFFVEKFFYSSENK